MVSFFGTKNYTNYTWPKLMSFFKSKQNLLLSSERRSRQDNNIYQDNE